MVLQKVCILSTRSKASILLKLLTVLVVVVLIAPCSPSSYETQWNKAQTYQSQGQPERSKQILDKLIQDDPGSIKALLLRGKINETNSEFEKAIADYSSAINLNPQITQAWSSRGSCYYRLGAFPNAMRDFSNAILLEPDNSDLYLYLGNTYGEMDMFIKAIENFNIAREISHGDYYSNLKKAYSDIYEKKYSSALGRATSAIEENPADPIAHSYKGISLYHLGDFNLAIYHLNLAKELEPNNRTTIYNLQLAHLAARGVKAEAGQE